MIIKKTEFNGLYEINPEKISDDRGYFTRTFCEKELKENGIDFKIVQINISQNIKRNTFRGLHYQQKPYEEAKIIQCIKGSICDIVVDLRKDSLTYKKYFTSNLSDIRNNLLLIPKGFIHGFYTLSHDTIVMYYMNKFYNPDFSKTINVLSPEFNIKLSEYYNHFIMSDKDREAPYFIKSEV